MTDTFGQVIAGGTQDLAALAGLFCTGSVEQSALSTTFGYGKVILSTLSVLGLIGLIKSTLKITLGATRCAAAGLNLDSVRGIFGYAPEETAVAGSIVDCSLVTVKLKSDRVEVSKVARRFDRKRTPMLTVGSDWPERIECKTAINLGNLAHEDSLLQSLWVIVPFAIVSAGSTAWTLLIIDYPWTWVRIMGTAVLHLMLVLMVAMPLWYSRQTEQPGRHITRKKWEWLVSPSAGPGTSIFLQAQVRDGTVLHFQGDVSLIQSHLVRTIAFVVGVVTTVGYVCQYAVVKAASDHEAIIWVCIQAFLAFVRAVFWVTDPSFDDPKTHLAEYALISNSCFRALTLMELASACRDGKTEIPMWVWNHLKSTTFQDLLMEAVKHSEDFIPPENATLYFGENISFDTIIQGRRGNHTAGELHDIGADCWRLAFWKDAKTEEVHPFFIVHVPYDPDDGNPEAHCWVQAVGGREFRESRFEDRNITPNMCRLFAAISETERIHIRSQSAKAKGSCDDNCPMKHLRANLENESTYRYLFHRGGISECVWSFVKDQENRELEQQYTNSWCYSVWITATPGTVDSEGIYHKLAGHKTSGSRTVPVDIDWLGEYIETRAIRYQAHLKQTRKEPSARDMITGMEAGKQYTVVRSEGVKGPDSK